MLGKGIVCGNPNFGASNIAMTAAGYYYSSLHAWNVMCNEEMRVKAEDTQSKYTVEMAHAMPTITNMAFACELAFKSLLPDENRPNSHGLRVIYDMLSPEYQRDIQGRVMSFTCVSSVEDFFSKLDECSNNFVDWRYFYEGKHGRIQGHYTMLKAMAEEVFDRYGIEYPD